MLFKVMATKGKSIVGSVYISSNSPDNCISNDLSGHLKFTNDYRVSAGCHLYPYHQGKGDVLENLCIYRLLMSFA